MNILTHRKIEQKIKRLAIEILERNTDAKELILAGINNNGLRFAQLIVDELQRISSISVHLTSIRLDPANPANKPVDIELPIKDIDGKIIIVVDDVANTGRTLFYACKPLLDIIPKKIEVAVLVDRTHKSFPVQVDYVGLSLATTLRENIEVNLKVGSDYSVNLL